MEDFFTDFRNIWSMASTVFGTGGFIYGWKKRKLSNFNLMQENYTLMIKHCRELLEDVKKLRKEIITLRNKDD